MFHLNQRLYGCLKTQAKRPNASERDGSRKPTEDVSLRHTPEDISNGKHMVRDIPLPGSCCTPRACVTALTEYVCGRLVSLGQSRQARWERQFKQLQVFVDEHGHADGAFLSTILVPSGRGSWLKHRSERNASNPSRVQYLP